MAKKSKMYICDVCGNETAMWSGKCPSCGEWNSLKELRLSKTNKKSRGTSINIKSVKNLESDTKEKSRLKTGLNGFDQILGGGLVPGEVVLLSGEPGVGKSTILLLIAVNFILNKRDSSKILYFSGEESESQIVDRLKRLNKNNQSEVNDSLMVSYATQVEDIVATIQSQMPDLVFVDSVQTLESDDVASAAGSAAQVKVAAQKLASVSKELDIPMILVGQITKGGMIAGPKLLEHLVDCVIRFEGDKVSDFRVLRSIKNRFGSIDEIALYKMDSEGLKEIVDSAEMFMSGVSGESGVVKSVIIYGQRPMVVEVQALLNDTSMSYPRRVAEGYSKNRLEVICAILERRLGLRLGDKDIFINVVGGVKVSDPALDLAVCAAIYSVYKDKPVSDMDAYFGEVGLAGQILRSVRSEGRVKEAKRVGLKRSVGNLGDKKMNGVVDSVKALSSLIK